ncbi:uncharacterized [Tachysurus ichikawai]
MPLQRPPCPLITTTTTSEAHACHPASDIRRDTCQQDAHPSQGSQKGVFELHVHHWCEPSIWSHPALTLAMF